MRIVVIVLLLGTIAACSQRKDNKDATHMPAVYTPGLGEFMTGIQEHHIKLWYAGKAENWKLAEFEISEIQESVEDVEKYCTDRPEIKSLPMIKPVLDSMKNAITAQNLKQFKSSYMLLTSTCNNCHRTTHHEFNVIQVPHSNPYTDQVFTKQKP